MENARYSAGHIGKWFLAWAATTEEALLSNLKLQKLLYYAQGHYLARSGGPLFPDRIEAWAHGPVVAGVYHEYKGFGKDPVVLADEDEFEWSDIDGDTTDLLIEVWEAYGQFGAWKLREMTHREPPWLETFDSHAVSKEIPIERIQAYFNTVEAS
jgi:uncharacterized phage-associated protein